MKKDIALFTSIVMILIVIHAMASEERKSGLYTYSIKGNGTITIIDYEWEKSEGDVYIPAMIDGYTVTGIGEKSFYIPSVYDTFIINDNRLLINSLQPNGDVNITLPNTITTVGEYAFFGAPVVSINIPDSLTEIGKGAFAFRLVDNERSVFNVAPTHSVFATIDGVLFNKAKKELIAFPYYGLDSEEQYVIPKGIVSIGDFAFYTSMEGVQYLSLVFPDTLNLIGEYAFCGRVIKGTGKINMNNILSIGEGAFARSTMLSTLDGVLSSAIKLETIPRHAFAENRFERIAIPNGVKDIGEYAFSEVEGRVTYNGYSFSVEIPGSVKRIEDYAFWGGDFDFESGRGGMTSLSMEEGVQYIGKRAFFNHKITTLSLPSTVREIDEYAFAKCRDLSNVELQEGLVKIGAHAFSECDNLKEIAIPASVDDIGNNAFDRSKTTLYVEKDSYAAKWANENGFSYKFNSDDTDWLNEQ